MIHEFGFSYPQLDEDLPWEPRHMRDAIRYWASEKSLIKHLNACYKAERFPTELISEMAQFGMFGIKTDSKYGGLGADNYMYGTICREIERIDSGLRSHLSVQNSLVMYPLEEFGSDEQKKRWLPHLIEGTAIGAFALTDIGPGSDPESMRTHARQDGSDYILNGSKRYITDGGVADFVLVWLKINGIVRCCIVEKGMPGFTASPMKDKMAMCASNTAELSFNDVRIPAENILPGTMERKRAYIPCLAEARSGIAWGVIGAASFCAEQALAYLDGRGDLLGKQLIQQDLTYMDSAIYAAQLRALDLAKRKDKNEQTVMDISRNKRDNVDMACDVARDARRLMGADGIMLEYGVMRHLCNLEAVYTYEGTTGHIHTLIMGREITGRNAF